MKRCCALLCAILAVAGCMGAAAVNITYELPELYMEIDFPEEWIILTGQTQEGDPGLYFYDDDLSYMQTVFEEQDIYLDGYDLENFYQLVVVMTPNEDVFDLALWDEGFVDEAADYFAQNPPWTMGNQAQCVREEDYYTADARFFSYDRIEQNGDVQLHCYQMSTIFNGQSIHFILTDYSEEDMFNPSGLKQLMCNIIDTVQFTEVLPVPGEFFEEEEPYVEPSSGMPSAYWYSIFPIILVILFSGVSRMAQKRQQAKSAAPMTMQSRSPVSAAPGAGPVRPQTPAAPPKIPDARPSAPKAQARPARAKPQADAGRVTPRAAVRAPKHNCSAEGEASFGRVKETVFCIDCGAKVSTSLKRCPHCGAPVV